MEYYDRICWATIWFVNACVLYKNLLGTSILVTLLAFIQVFMSRARSSITTLSLSTIVLLRWVSSTGTVKYVDAKDTTLFP